MAKVKNKGLKKLLMIVLLLGIIIIPAACQNKAKKLDINSVLVQSLYKKVNPSVDGNILTKLYKKPGEFNNDYILTTAIKMYIDNHNSQSVETITKKDLENNIYQIFGKEITFEHHTVYVFFDSYCMFRYDKNKELYTLDGGCGGNTNEYFYRKIVEATESAKELTIYEKCIYVYYEWEDGTIDYGHVSIYNNLNDKKLIKSYEQNSNDQLKINIDDYLEEASTYKYVFEKVDNNYIFKNIELIK